MMPLVRFVIKDDEMMDGIVKRSLGPNKIMPLLEIADSVLGLHIHTEKRFRSDASTVNPTTSIIYHEKSEIKPLKMVSWLKL